VRFAAVLLVSVALVACRVLTHGLDAAPPGPSADATTADATVDAAVDRQAADAGEPPGLAGAPLAVGCADGTREGFRNLDRWPVIAGCSGAFGQAGVVGSPDLSRTCGHPAGDTATQPTDPDCSAADLCAAGWHVCRNAAEVAQRSGSGCEGCVPAGEPRFFLVAAGASTMGVCSPDPQAANDLHGCGGLGQAESDGCAPLSRRLGFADCLTTDGVWSCGGVADSTREAAVVTKTQTTLGGVLCCRD
jgi:hypothetical protein